MTFKNALEAIGKDFLKGLSFAFTYAIPVERLVGTLFPAAAPAAAGLADATQLIQSAVMLVEQKYAAANAQSGTGAQKLADVLQLAGPTVTTLLKQAGITASTGYIQSLVSAVVATLNVQPPPAATTAA